MIIEEKTVKREVIYEGKIINLRIDTVELPEKKYATREIVEHPGAVAVIPITANNEIIMVRQYRKPIEEFLLEVPAGKLEDREDPLSCAMRELKEETGYTSDHMKFLFHFYTSPGFSNEIMYLYIAQGLVSGKATPDKDEYIHVETYSINDLINMIYEGKIKDSKTIVAIMAAKDFLKK